MEFSQLIDVNKFILWFCVVCSVDSQVNYSLNSNDYELLKDIQFKTGRESRERERFFYRYSILRYIVVIDIENNNKMKIIPKLPFTIIKSCAVLFYIQYYMRKNHQWLAIRHIANNRLKSHSEMFLIGWKK